MLGICLFGGWLLSQRVGRHVFFGSLSRVAGVNLCRGGPWGLETLCTNLKSLGSTWCFSCRFWEGSLHIISRSPLQHNFVGSPMYGILIKETQVVGFGWFFWVPDVWMASMSEFSTSKRNSPVSPGCVWKCRVPLYPMVLLIIIPMKNCYFIGNINPTFSDKPTENSGRDATLRSPAGDNQLDRREGWNCSATGMIGWIASSDHGD